MVDLNETIQDILTQLGDSEKDLSGKVEAEKMLQKSSYQNAAHQS